jgi:hypothetical protein
VDEEIVFGEETGEQHTVPVLVGDFLGEGIDEIVFAADALAMLEQELSFVMLIRVEVVGIGVRVEGIERDVLEEFVCGVVSGLPCLLDGAFEGGASLGFERV